MILLCTLYMLHNQRLIKQAFVRLFNNGVKESSQNFGQPVSLPLIKFLNGSRS
ncbi:hypothetical protein PALA35_06191 [Pseudomonas aeruginosa]|nr:hypothetical protein PALA35_06191 [Pseudomonas aeruginosa]